MAYMPDQTTLGATAGPAATFSSNTFSAWQKLMAGQSAAAPVVTANAGSAPDGSQTASRVVLNRGVTNTGNSGAYSILRATSIPGTNGALYCDSLYIRTFPGAAASQVDIRSALQGVTETNKVITTSDVWQRVSLISPPIVNAQQDFDLLLWDAAHLTPKTSLIADVLVWGFRVDPGSVPLGPDYTNGAAPGKLSPLALVGIGVAAFALFGGNGRR